MTWKGEKIHVDLRDFPVGATVMLVRSGRDQASFAVHTGCKSFEDYDYAECEHRGDHWVAYRRR